MTLEATCNEDASSFFCKERNITLWDCIANSINYAIYN